MRPIDADELKLSIAVYGNALLSPAAVFRAIDEAKTVSAETPDAEFLKTADVAKLLGVSDPIARAFMHRADFPLLTEGKTMRVSKSALLRWAEQRRD